ncbi:MAG: hypothetical protein R3B72_02955 [Polyangiaceae bacterium]
MADARPLDVMVFDATCTARRPSVGLSDAWWAGGRLYDALGRIEHHHGARSWGDALAWLAEVEPSRPLGRIQYWGHGRWGRALLGGEGLGIEALAPQHPHHRALARIRERLDPEAGALWFRTCELFGARAGQDFARRWADFFARPVAGHTYIIGFWQSGLHRLAPGEIPTWSPDEGLLRGDADDPKEARWSRPWLPNTISCLRGSIPAGW